MHALLPIFLDNNGEGTKLQKHVKLQRRFPIPVYSTGRSVINGNTMIPWEQRDEISKIRESEVKSK